MTTPLDKAEAAFQEAAQVGTADAWRDAAVLLFKVRRKLRKVPARGKGRYPGPVAVATFTDGRIVIMSFWSQKGRPLDWERAARVTSSAYRTAYPNHPVYAKRYVPGIVQIYEKTTGETYIPGTVPGQDRREAA